jgi:hypothetical protein
MADAVALCVCDLLRALRLPLWGHSRRSDSAPTTSGLPLINGHSRRSSPCLKGANNEHKFLDRQTSDPAKFPEIPSSGGTEEPRMRASDRGAAFVSIRSDAHR